MGYDFAFYWLAARSIVAGHSPYLIDGFMSPPPFAIIMVPLGLISFDTAWWIWTLINVVSLVVLAKKQSLKALLFLPVAFAIFVGQMDLPILALGLYGGWMGLALTALKPQLAVWIIPFVFYRWWREGKIKDIVLTIASLSFLYGLPLLLVPSWWTEWRNNSPSIFQYAEHASSLYGISALTSFPVISFFVIALLSGVIFVVWHPVSPRQFWCFVALFNPVSNAYSLCVLIDQLDWVSIVLSWIALILSSYVHTGLSFIIIPIYMLLHHSQFRISQRKLVSSVRSALINAP